MEIFYSAKHKYGLLLTMLAIFLFLGTTNASAQKVLWETGYPKMSAETLGTYGDPVAMELKFSVSEVALTSSEFKITLPAGIKFQDVTKEADDTSGTSYTGSLNGQVVTVTPSGTINVGAVVDIKINVTAESCNEADVSFNVDIHNNGAKIADATRQAKVLVRKPAVRVLSPNPSVESTQFDQFKQFTLNIDVANGLKAKSLTVVLEKDDFTDLANFKLGTTDLAPKVAISGNTTTITLDESVLQGSLVGTGSKTLTFDAKSPIGSTRTIKVSGQYPAEEACSAIASINLTLTNPTIPGTPNFELPATEQNRRWVSASDMDGANLKTNSEVVMDGVTISYLRLEYQNTGTAGSIQLKNKVQPWRSQPYTYGYVVADKIQYSIDGGVTKVTIPASDVVISKVLQEDNGYRKLKPGIAGLPEDVTVTINKPVDAGKNIVIYWPIVQGDIYDNDTYRPTISAGTAPYSSLQFMMYTLTATGGNGEAAAVPSNTYGNGNIALPKFMSSLSSQGMRNGEHEESKMTVDLGGISKNDNQTVDFNVKLPAFIEIDGALEDAIQLLGVDATGKGTYEDLGGGHYRVRYDGYPTQPDPSTGNPVGTSVNTIEVRYKVKDGECTGTNQSGEIEYWFDWNLGGNTPLRPTLKKIAKLYQPVTLYCEKDGVEMKGFNLRRITRGLKDSDENYVPDDGQLALENEMRHDVYLKNDEGQIVIKGEMVDTYQNMYMLLTTDFKLKDNVMKLDQTTIKVGSNPEESIDLKRYASDSLFYVEYNKEIKRGAQFSITIPFKMTAANNLSKAFDAELYVSNTKQVDPFAPIDRKGTDKTGRTVTVYAEAFATDKANETFANNDVKEKVTLPYFDSYHGNNFYTPYFSNEIRRLAKPLKYEFELPAGFLLKSDLRVANAQRRDQHVKDNPFQMIPFVAVEELANGNTLYSADIASLFQNDVNTQADADALPATKWMHPDDIFNYQFAVDIQATKGAAITTKVKATITFENAVENDSIMTRFKEFNMAYTGDRTTLEIVPNVIKAQEETIHIPVVTVGNPNAYDSEMWIFVEGNVKNVSAISTTGGTKIAGSGIEGRWVALGKIPPRTAPNYSIDFETIDPICDSTTIRVYTVSRFQDAGWSPNLSKPVDPTDIEHIAASKPVHLMPTVATVEGSIVTSTDELEYQKPYTLTAAIDSKASESALVDPQMTLTIPSGQQYVAGTAKVEYPTGTLKAVPAAVETKLLEVLASGATLETTREYTVIVKDLIGSNVLHGFGDNTVTDDDRVVKLVMDFTPMCETPLTGIRFEGALTGNNLCGIVANGAEKRERSVEMFSTLAAEYEFSANVTMLSGNRAFNEIRKEDKLKVDITKSKGIDALLASDALYLYLPKYLNIKDASEIVINSTDITSIDGSKATIVSNTEVEGVRVIAIQLPVDAINASSSDHGLGKGLSLTADLVYTPNRKDLELVGNPVQTIKTIVTTNKQFSPSCPDAPLAIGSANLDVALVTASENPYTGEVGTELTLEIISTDYAGEWFDVETGGTALSSDATYKYTPADVNDKTFYVSAVFNGVDYGRVPVLVTNLPILDFTVTNPAPLCVDSEIDLSTLVSGFAQGVIIKYYSDVDLKNEVTDTKVKVKAKTTYYVVATNGTSTSAAKEIVIETLAATAITTQPVATTVNFDGTITLSVVATGENLKYQWQKDGVDIAGATSDTYTKANATDGDNGVYSVIVTGDCGSLTSATVQVTVHPSLDITITQPDPICQTEEIDLTKYVTTLAGVTAKYYSDADGKNELTSTTVKPNVSTTYYVKAVNAGGAEGVLQAIDVEVIAATAITTQPVATTVNFGGTINLSVVATGENLKYQWQKDGVDINGATSTTYSKEHAEDPDKGIYTVVITGDCGVVTSANAQVNVYPTLDFTVSDPAPICETESVDLAQYVSAQAGTIVKYYSDAAAKNELASATVKPNASTTYYVKSANAGGVEGDIKPIDVQVLIATLISTQPAATTVNFEGTITLSVVSAGENLKYQWKKDGTDIAGATSNTYTKANATEVENGVYSVVVTGDCGVITSATAQVTVHPSLELTISDPAAICATETLDLASLVTAKPGVTVKYYSDAAGKNELVSSVVKPNVSTTYYVKAVAGTSEGTLQAIDVEVLAATAITNQPVATTVNFEGTITLSVVATGENLEYQWKKDGTDIAGATSNTYTKANATEVENGVYSVVVTGDCGVITSATAQVTVHPSLELTISDPAAICATESVDLANFVTAKPGVTVKYYSDAAGKNELVSSVVKPNISTTYYVKAVAGTSEGTLQAIDVEVLAATAITNQPVATTVNFDGTITLSVVATGENLKYQWKKGGTDIAGATSATYTKANATESENGVYSVVVTGDCGVITSATAQVTVHPSLELTISDPAAICATESVDLANFVTAKPGVTVKYYSDAAGKNELASSVVKPSVSTTFYAKAVNAAGVGGNLYPIEIKVNALPEASISTSTNIVCANTEGEITLNLQGKAPWKVVYTDGTKDYTVTATTSTYSFKVMVGKETTYTLKSVTDALNCGEGKVSGSATIAMEEPVVITKQPESIAFCVGDRFALDIEATGAVDYQWFKDGKPVNGGTTDHLEVNDAEKAMSGEYYVVVTGKCGTVTSNKITVRATLSDIIVQKWNNTLVANNNSSSNGGYNFVSYKWFKNGTQIDQGPYHTVGNNPNSTLDMGAAYTLEVTTDKGEVFMTCPFYPSLKNASVILYPNPAKVGEPVTIEVQTEDGSTPNGIVEMYSITGLTLTPKKVVDKITQVSFNNPGMYIVKYKSGKFNQDFKVIVK